jgi:hypothetical protein
MDGFFQFVAMLALGAVVAWLVRHWITFVGDQDIAFLIGFPALCLIGWIYDRRRARLKKSNAETIEPEQ